MTLGNSFNTTRPQFSPLCKMQKKEIATLNLRVEVNLKLANAGRTSGDVSCTREKVALRIYSHTSFHCTSDTAFLQTDGLRQWSISATSPTAFAYFVYLRHIVAVLAVFQTLHWQKAYDSLTAQVMVSNFEQ